MAHQIRVAVLPALLFLPLGVMLAWFGALIGLTAATMWMFTALLHLVWPLKGSDIRVDVSAS